MGNTYDQTLLNKVSNDKFILTLNLPEKIIPKNKKALRNNATFQFDKLQMSVYGTVVPSNSIPQKEVRYAGSNVHISSHNKPTYDPVTVNFTIDNEFNNYWVINSWLNWIRNEKTGVFSGDVERNDHGPKQYSANFILTALDEYNNEIIQWVYKQAFPIELGEINYNNRESDQIDTYFKFAFASVETILLNR